MHQLLSRELIAANGWCVCAPIKLNYEQAEEEEGAD